MEQQNTNIAENTGLTPDKITAGNPLVTVVITCYNHAKYLPESIESVLDQSYTNIELIVVDDGSADNTKEVTLSYPGVKYVWQKNQGLSAARNTGIANSSGEYIAFLDADDYFYTDGIKINVGYFLQHPECAFVAGYHNKVDSNKNLIPEGPHTAPLKDHFKLLLTINFIGMHAAVLYKTEIIKHFPYDISLPACEDYDMYLRITREWPVFTHAEKIAAYRIHGNNMSGDAHLILTNVTRVLHRIKSQLKTKEELRAYHTGIKMWRNYYSMQVIKKLKAEKSQLIKKVKKKEIMMALKFKPHKLIIHYLTSFMPGKAAQIFLLPGSESFGLFFISRHETHECFDHISMALFIHIF